MKNDNVKLKSLVRLYLYLFVFVFLIPVASAQESSFALTITPPLFQMTASPGQDWSSAIKVVNNNSYDIVVYATLVNFQAEGEGGVGKFIPSNNASDVPGGYSLASWFEVSKDPISIRAEQSASVPFTLHVPETAEPGGHYGAILIGTEPPKNTGGGAVVRVSSQLASLFLVRVNGDVEEKGDIRSFSSEKTFYQEPHASFSLRFENKGNVHLLPQGDITIYNMWGKERGRVIVNEESDFGNVLPESIRNFTFEWAGEKNFFDIGRYKAIATLAFGDKEKKTVYRTASFWVIPVIPILKISAFLIIFAWFIVWSIRRYVKKALLIESERLKSLGIAQKPVSLSTESVKKTSIRGEVLARPLVLGAVDLRRVISKETETAVQKPEEKMSITQFIKNYKLFFVFLIVAFLGIIGISKYFGDVLARYRNFNVQVTNENTKHELQIPKK